MIGVGSTLDDVRETGRLVVTVGRTVVVTAQRDQVTFLAAAVAYYAFVSLIPLLALVLVVTAAVGGRDLVDRVLAETGAVLTPEVQTALAEALVGGTGRIGATFVGTLVVLWGGLRMFRGIDKAFSQVYGTAGEKSILGELRDGALVLACIGIGLAVMTVAGIVLQLLPLGPFAGVAGSVLVFLSLIVVFLPMYYVFPDTTMTVRAALPGAVVTALGWTLLGALFSVYVALAGTVALYGILGGILLLVTLLYAGAFVLIVGAVCNAVVERDRQLQQDGRREPPQRKR